jgi:hypothetical protein
VRTGEHAEYLARGFHGGRQAPRFIEDEGISNNNVQKITEESYDFYSCKHNTDTSKCTICPLKGDEAIKIPLGSNFTCKTSGVIYEYDCKFCTNCYIGRTDNEFRVRAGSHGRDVKLGNPKALAQHIQSHLEKHPEMAEVTDINKWYRMKIVDQVSKGENIAAKEQQHILNKNPKDLINKIDAVKQPTPLKKRKNI